MNEISRTSGWMVTKRRFRSRWRMTETTIVAMTMTMEEMTAAMIVATTAKMVAMIDAVKCTKLYPLQRRFLRGGLA